MMRVKATVNQQTLPMPRLSDRVHLEWVRELGISSFTGLRILDLGCGSGYLARLALDQGAMESVGLDIEEPREGFGPGARWTFVQADLDRSDWQTLLGSDKFDIVFAFDIIEHLRSPVAFLEQCRELLNTKGQLFLTTPNTQSLERILNPDSWSGAFDPQHRILFSKYSLGFLLRKSGLQPESLRAPMRLLRWLPRQLQPSIGGQLVALAKRLDSF